MKKYFLFLAMTLFAAATFVSCKDDDDSSISQSTLIGKWITTEQTSYLNGVQVSTDTQTRDTVEFTSSAIILKEQGSTTSQTGTYSLSGNKITVTISGETTTSTIKGTSSPVTVTTEQSETISGVTISYKSVQKLTKL
jgi:hypothetical protein